MKGVNAAVNTAVAVGDSRFPHCATAEYVNNNIAHAVTSAPYERKHASQRAISPHQQSEPVASNSDHHHQHNQLQQQQQHRPTICAPFENDFFYDTPFTSDAPMHTCDLSLSQDDPGAGNENGNYSTTETGRAADMEVVPVPEKGCELDFATQRVPTEDSWSPQHDGVSVDSREQLNACVHAPCTTSLRYWDEVVSSQGEAEGAMFRLRGITNRVLRLKTAAPENHRSSSAGREFNIAVELDDGHNLIACRVSDELAQRFLDMTAQDFELMTSQLSKAEVKAVKQGLMGRFQHFHGLFWVCRCQDETGGGSDGCSMVLIDFAQEDVQGLCAELLCRHC